MMSTRITGFNGRFGVRRRVATVRSWSRRRRYALGSAIVLLGVLAACSSSGTYPVDIFSEMHYSEAYRSFEPPRFLSPEGAVPVTGRGPAFAPEELGQLENPVDADEASTARGQVLFNTNCVVCHGAQGNGDGLMAPQFETYGARPPADLTAERLQDVPDSYIYSVIYNGLGQYMPPFRNLIDGDAIWDLVNYVRSLQQ